MFPTAKDRADSDCQAYPNFNKNVIRMNSRGAKSALPEDKANATTSLSEKSPSFLITTSDSGSYQSWRRQMSITVSANQGKWSKGPCDKCFNILWMIANASQRPHPNPWYDPEPGNLKGHWNSVTELGKSSKNCDLCKLILASLKDASSKETFYSVELTGKRDSFNHVDLLRGLEVGRGYYPKKDLRIFTSVDDVLADTIIGRPVDYCSGSANMLVAARKLVQQCYATHEECQQARATTHEFSLPTRVIDIGETDGRFHLVTSNGKRGQWAALSHRWGRMTWGDRLLKGKKQILRAVTQNLVALQQDIPRSQLPTTFLDAITITRAIGLRYLWIDSLCILQDSAEDWERESGLMTKVYNNAFVTISAGASKDSLGGIFTERPWTKTSTPVRMPVLSQKGIGTVTFDVNPFDDPFKLISGKEANYLDVRGWCFQESHLSPRLLTFDRAQMSFTCVRCFIREGEALSNEFGKNDLLTHIWGPVGGESYESALRLWYKLVENYSARDLTFADDKFVAISGIAGIFNDYVSDEYYAGIWMRTLPLGLLWSPHHKTALFDNSYRDKLKNSVTYRAPSWSWAAIDGIVRFDICCQTRLSTEFSSILEIDVETAPSNPYGRVSNGSLKISGPLKRAFCGPQHILFTCQPFMYWTKKAKGDYDETENVARCMLDTKPLKEGSEIWCLQVTQFCGLVLRPVSSSPGTYTRIGVFCRDQDSNHYEFEEITSLGFQVEDVRTIIIR